MRFGRLCRSWRRFKLLMRNIVVCVLEHGTWPSTAEAGAFVDGRPVWAAWAAAPRGVGPVALAPPDVGVDTPAELAAGGSAPLRWASGSELLWLTAASCPLHLLAGCTLAGSTEAHTPDAWSTMTPAGYAGTP